ncbi:MAG: protein kinase, partial [Planctomycetales bacterium]|nr:protein kinase [Planctomycetales bacterium]
PRFAAWLVAALADAVEHAHRRGILHRDVKPGNVLLEPAPNEPFGCTPKLTDFGLAKIIERDSTDQDTTASHLLMGTPRYMSPEQAAGRRDEIGTATDIYSLGVVLYELLTGVPPVVGGNHAETLQRLLLEEPVRPRQRTPAIPRDLEAICLKCLEKRPERRFGHASQLAEDLRRFLRGDTTHARPLSRTEAMRRWAVRHPVRATIVSASLLVWLVLLGSLVGYTRLLQQSGRRIERSLQEARAARMQAMTSEARLREMLYVADMKLAKRALDDGDLRQVTRLLETHKKHDAQSDLRDFSWRFLHNSSNQRQRLLATCPSDVYQIRFSRNGDRLAAACKDGIARIYECEGWSPVAEIETGQGELNGVSFSPDASRLATAGDDGTAVVWRVEDGQRLLTIPALPRLAFQALFSPDGKTIVTCGESPVIGLWDSETGESLGSLLGHEKPVEAIAISPDGRWLASASSDRTTKLWNLAELKLERNWSQHENRATTIAFSGDGQRLAAGTVEGNAIVWDVESRKRLLDVQHLDGVQSVTFSPNGQSLLVSDRSGAARLWPIDSQLAPLAQPDTLAWQAHEGRTWSAAYSADGEFAVTSGADGSIRLWRLSGAAVRVIRGSFANPFVDISIADEQLVTLRKDTGLRTRSLPGCETIQLVENHGGAWMTTCRLTPHHFIIGTEDGRLLLWDMEANEVVTEWATEFKSQIEAIRLSREGRLLAVHFYDEDTVTLFEIKHT